MKDLNPNEESFCREYLTDGNSSAAYIRAGFKVRAELLESEANKLLASDDIQFRILEMRAKKSGREGRLNSQIMKELEKIAFADVSDNPHISTREQLSALDGLATILGMKADLNIALAILRRYGISLVVENGKWKLLDEQVGFPGDEYTRQLSIDVTDI